MSSVVGYPINCKEERRKDRHDNEMMETRSKTIYSEVYIYNTGHEDCTAATEVTRTQNKVLSLRPSYHHLYLPTVPSFLSIAFHCPVPSVHRHSLSSPFCPPSFTIPSLLSTVIHYPVPSVHRHTISSPFCPPPFTIQSLLSTALHYPVPSVHRHSISRPFCLLHSFAIQRVEL